ncbi:YraN family protein [Vulgatibacter incomptus]|uniref:UPF0102 protein AKJ08_1667 n=1 Tax=Vulgatibacter incomptus TaxID=1391653 RepID=A0A0K1PCN8_9BACT|nr:YraN family protein [Vulgatibacter incomptus]AKU91280.1 putative endonuclease distantly related to archaeal Holliday junction resolvase [Vulgatibacter incomptus]
MSRAPARPSERRARGLAAEARAAAWLEEQGWEILDRNHVCRRGEVDIVASKGDTLVFVEVRSRTGTGFGHPLESISFRKRRRVIAAATDWAVRANLLNQRFIRFDVITVIDRGEGEDELHWIEGAFDAEGAC